MNCRQPRFVACLLATALVAGSQAVASTARRPNFVIIITDDMGFSDIGCYGGEIETPHIDRLAEEGIRFSQFYNCSKCEPSRATLLRGHYWHSKPPGLNWRHDAPTFGQALQQAGYRTMMVGKWHVHGAPLECGFHRHFGFMRGGTDFFRGDETFTLDGKPWPVPKEGFYVTESLTEYAVRFLREERRDHPNRPLMLHLAYNAPHSPIQALPRDVAKYRGRYRKGWDTLREERFRRQQKMGLAGAGWHLPPRPAGIPAWDALDGRSRDFEDLRMATYAGMVECVDRGVGKVLAALDELGLRENTLVVFMNDNGASPNDRSRRGKFGEPGSQWNVGLGWAHASNTPFKFYKRTQHSGGVTTPFIARWPAAIKPTRQFEDQPCHFIDLFPTLVDLAGTEYPHSFGGHSLPALPGRSIAPVLTKGAKLPERTLYFQLFNNFAVVDRGWRLASAYGQPWRLYDLTNDRTETCDLARVNPQRLTEMLDLQKRLAARDDVAMRVSAGELEPEHSPVYRADGRPGPPESNKVKDETYARLVSSEQSKGQRIADLDLDAIRERAEAIRARPPAAKNPKRKRRKGR